MNVVQHEQGILDSCEGYELTGGPCRCQFYIKSFIRLPLPVRMPNGHLLMRNVEGYTLSTISKSLHSCSYSSPVLLR
jgi:hypothetical protein